MKRLKPSVKIKTKKNIETISDDILIQDQIQENQSFERIITNTNIEANVNLSKIIIEEINNIPEEYIDCLYYVSELTQDSPPLTTTDNNHNIIQSIGRISGGDISYGTNSKTIKCSYGIYYCKINDNGIEVINTFDIPETDNISININCINYVYVDYNDSNPVISIASNFTNINFTNQFVIGVCMIDIHENITFIGIDENRI